MICYSNYFTNEETQAHRSARLCAKPQSWKQWENPGLSHQDPVFFPQDRALSLLPAEIAPRPVGSLSSGISVLEKLQQHLLLWGKKETDRILWMRWLRFKFQLSLNPLTTSRKLLYSPGTSHLSSGTWTSLCGEPFGGWSPWASWTLWTVNTSEQCLSSGARC